MAEDSIKMFVGIRIPTEISESLESFRDTHFDNLEGIQWTAPSNLHITLRFLGPQTMQSANMIAEGLANISASPVGITLTGGGVFEEAGVLFVNILPAPELMQLQTSVDRVARANGVPPSQYWYTPHISVGHLREMLMEHTSPRNIFSQAAIQLDEFCQRSPLHHFLARDISLFDSLRGCYRVRRSFRLDRHSAREKCDDDA